MSYIIKPSVASASVEDLLSVTDAELNKAADFFEKGAVQDLTTISVTAGLFFFTDGRSDLEFTDYEGKVAASFRDTEGNRILITVDGGMLNVTTLVADLRKAVHDARL